MRAFAIYLSIAIAMVAGNRDAQATSSKKVEFSPAPGFASVVTANGQEVTVVTKKGNQATTERIQIEAEKSLALNVDDYNFDGLQDFSVSHIDDGMGTYTIYQIYAFSRKDGKFHLMNPKCGDEFINIVVSKKDKSITNSYFADNQMKTCTAKYE